MEQNQQEGKNSSFQNTFCFLSKFGMNKTVWDFFLPLSSACKNSFDVDSKRNFLDKEMKQEGTKHIFLKSTGKPRLG